jgi:hypothetical protein
LKLEKCSSFNTESGCSNPDFAISSVFFEHTASRIPRLRSARHYS